MGADKVRDDLPPLVEAVRDAGAHRHVAQRPDARQHVHVASPATRRVASTRSSTRCAGSSRCTRPLGTTPGGIHVELTGDDVTEIMGGTEEIDEASLALRYETLVDPRLNHQQSLELAFLVSELLAKRAPRVELL